MSYNKTTKATFQRVAFFNTFTSRSYTKCRYPFGSLVPNRHGSTADYRYGFNGKEKDDEVMGEGNFQDYGMRMYNPRIGRFFNVDPLTAMYPYLTPYQFASNRPIDGNDLDGKEWAGKTTEITKPDGTILVTTELVVKVKVENRSSIVTDPAIVRAKAEVIKTKIEKEGTTTLTYTKEGKSYTENVNTIVVLDYNPPTENDGNIGYLIFDDRITKKTVTTKTIGNSTTTTTTTNLIAGDNKGIVNRFKTSIGITVDGVIVPDTDIADTGTHEIFGHSAGLNHPWELSGTEKLNNPTLDQTDSTNRVEKTIIDNFMNTSDILPIESKLAPSNVNQILPGQVKTIKENVLKKSLYEVDELKPKTK
ncbi:RHS repeat-associated core domain-containing protein [Flavobacterium sp.]|uniref:RHS repeat-associated core domain-containing protein n=1 Tax=Flavobacterium sp. TaxID=239 RepID=UPI003919E5F3